MLGESLQTASHAIPSIASLTEIGSNLAVGVSAMVVAIAAVSGLNTWRKRSKSEASQKVLGQARRFIRRLDAARTMHTYGAESADRPRKPDESLETTKIWDEHYARMKRVENPGKALDKLYELGWDAEAVLGKDIEPLLEPFLKVFNSVVNAIEKMQMANSAENSVPVFDNDEKCEAEMRVYGVDSENDPVASELQLALDELRRALKRHL
jgi:hypothetical protein